MSNGIALALIVTTVVSASFLALSTLDKCTERAGQIINGVQNGIPISSDHQKLLVYQSFLPPLMNMVFVNVFSAMVMLGVAASVAPDSFVRWVAYATLIFHVAAALQWLVQGAISAHYLLSSVRRAEAD